jgi:hypothetical protein
MSDNFCLPKSYLLIILCVFMGLTVFYFHFKKVKQIDYNNGNLTKQTENFDYKMILDNIAKLTKQAENKQAENKQAENKQAENKQAENKDDLFLERRKVLEFRDAQVKYNDFKPPERRIPEYAYPDNSFKQIINIPTRGEPDNYQMMGVLLRQDTETVFNLFGRQKYPGSNQYEYYAQSNLNNNNVKLPITTKGEKELYDDDNVNIPGMNGQFKVKLYSLDVPRYNPFVI